MKCNKSTLLTILCTLVVLTSFVWIKKSIPVSFEIDAPKAFESQVFYTIHEDETINEAHSIRHPVSQGKSTHTIDLPIKKIYKFRFDFGNNPETVTIKNLTLSGKALDFHDFVFNKHIASKTIGTDTLTITSTTDDPYIVYKKDLNISPHITIDWCYFLIVLCASWFIFSKGIGYLARFKVFENHSRIDIVFLSIFFILLFIPMLNISDAEKSEQENRMLAAKPHLVHNGVLDNAFGTKFNDWFNDHFWGRKKIIFLYNFLRFGESKGALIGKNGWLFGKSFNAVKMYQNANLFTDEELTEAGHNIDQFVTDAKAAGIKQVYFMLSNDKESMYPEFYPRYIKKQNTQSRLEQILDYVHTHYPHIHFLNFKSELEKLKEKETIFYKTGTHMNHIGAFYEYAFLMQEIKKDFPELKILTLDDFDISVSQELTQPGLDIDLYKQFATLAFYDKKNFENKILKPKYSIPQTTTQNLSGYFVHKIWTNPHANTHLNLVVVSDSFLARYSGNLPLNFMNTYHVQVHSGRDFSQINSVSFQPDIMIVATTERFLQRFLTLKFPQKIKE